MSTPTLHDDRVQKMRMSVMHRVDQDVSRRGRRVRAAIGLAAAGVVVVGLGGYAVNVLQSDQQSVSASSYDSSGGSDAGFRAADEAAPDAAREVITTGTVSVTVDRPRAAAQQLSTWVETIGGRVDERSESGRGDDSTASVTVRVPSARVAATIDRLRTYGTVDDVSLQNTDVTSQARDLDARIDALQLSIDRLTAILAGTTSSGDVIKAEKALTQRQEQLESLQAQRKGITDQVSLSTVTVTLSQQPTAGSVEPGGFTGGLRDGWNALVSTVNAVVGIAGLLLPWALIAAVVALGWRLIARRRRNLS